MFGGWAGLNIYVLRQGVDVSGKRSCALCLVTYGRRLMQEDSPNTCCVYFQVKYGSLSDHFEAVVDSNGRHRWNAQDTNVQNVLLHAFEYSNLAVVVEDNRLKQLTAASNRINADNEKLQVGDLAWLWLDDGVIEQVIQKMKTKRQPVPAVPER